MKSILLMTTLLAACSAGDTDCLDTAACTGNEQTPATGKLDDIDAWLASGAYLTWRCEAEPHASRGSSPHSQNRVCSNELLANNTGPEYPVGAANVKELYEGGKVKGYAIMLKAKAGATGSSWYWFERLPGGRYPANGLGDDSCTGCHSKAPSDSVFTQVK